MIVGQTNENRELIQPTLLLSVRTCFLIFVSNTLLCESFYFENSGEIVSPRDMCSMNVNSVEEKKTATTAIL